MNEIKARFINGVLEPLEPLDLEEGQEVSLIIKRILSPEEKLESLRSAFGGWKGTNPDPEKLKEQIYADRALSTRPPPNW